MDLIIPFTIHLMFPFSDAQYQFKSRKSRSKSSSKLRLKRLGGGVDGTSSRSPSVKGRLPRDSEDAPLVPKAPLVSQSVPLAPQAPMVPLARGHQREGRRREGGGTSSDES